MFSVSVTDRPLRPVTDRSLGKPLPYQLADGTQAHLLAIAFMKRPPLTPLTKVSVVLSGISPPFGRLSPTKRQITYVLLTRAPLYYGAEAPILARLACVRRAANVRSEPGSNSPVNLSSSRGSSLAGPSRLYRSFALHLWICRDPPVLLSESTVQFSKNERGPRHAFPSKGLVV